MANRTKSLSSSEAALKNNFVILSEVRRMPNAVEGPLLHLNLSCHRREFLPDAQLLFRSRFPRAHRSRYQPARHRRFRRDFPVHISFA